MLIHEYISTKIIDFLDYFYYNNLKKLYNENIDDLFYNLKFPIIKPDFFIYIQYYLIYNSLYFNNYLIYSFSLNLLPITNIIFDNLLIKYNYIPTLNINFLKDSSYFLFLYLLSLKIIFLKINFIKKAFLSILIFSFFSIMNINYIYKERLKYIELKQDFRHPLKILIISPSKAFIEKIIYKTRYFTYNNFILLLNICIFFMN